MPGSPSHAAEDPAVVGAVLAVKDPRRAKSRLAELEPPVRRRLAWCMALDTLRALGSEVDRIVVVSDAPGLQAQLAAGGSAEVEVLPDPPGGGMNAALRVGEARLRQRGVGTVLACVADLPALRPDTVRRVLTAAKAFPRCFLADATGIGTTMLIAHGAGLDPRFQGRSAAAHRVSGAIGLTDDLTGGPVTDARRDVDTEVDLYDAIGIGLGPASHALVVPGRRALGRSVVITAAAGGSAITADGVRVGLPASALDPSLRSVRNGQRLHAVLDEGADAVVLNAWI